MARFRDFDGHTRRVTATASSKPAAERALRALLAERARPGGEEINSDTRLHELARYWLAHLNSEQRIEASTINEYRRILEKVVLPALAGRDPQGQSARAAIQLDDARARDDLRKIFVWRADDRAVDARVTCGRRGVRRRVRSHRGAPSGW